VAFRAVYVAVLQLFAAGLADINYGDIEVEVLTCQRMVGVYGDMFVIYGHYGDNLRAVLTHGLKLHPNFNLVVTFEHLFGDLLGQLV
jgi:hypothetical protein